MDRVILVAYSEIGLKSPPVRRHLENLLMRHIKQMLELKGHNITNIRKAQGRIILEDPVSSQVLKVVTKVFGVAYATLAIRIHDDFQKIIDTIVKVAHPILEPNSSFAIEARRIGNQPYTSQDIEEVGGTEILATLSDRKVHVNLKHPDKTIYVEARGRHAYIYHKIFHGYSGLPFGSQGKVVSLFSGGIDSPVATWLMMKRGCRPHLLFCDQRPYVGEDYYEKALHCAKKIREYAPLKNCYLTVLPTGEIMREIIEKVPSKLICVCCKRMMYRLGSCLARKLGCEGLVTGENLGQVASQTLYNLRVLDEASSYPVFRPLIGYEKQDSVQLAKKIGTYQISTTSAHGCTAVPKRPTAKAKMIEVKQVEANLNVSDLVSKALQGLTAILL